MMSLGTYGRLTARRLAGSSACLKCSNMVPQEPLMVRWASFSGKGTPAKRTAIEDPMSADIVDERDFRDRKLEIQELDYAEQDKRYYPTIDAARESLGTPEAKTYRIPEFRETFEAKFVADGGDQRLEDVAVVAGKIKSIRRAGKGSIFVDIVQDYTKVQLMIYYKAMGLTNSEFRKLHDGFRRGDQVIGLGNPSVTKTGELSLRLTTPLKLASPALHPLPPKLTDAALINRNRVVDYLVNEKPRQVLLTRARIISLTRRFLEDRGFIEVQTPLLGSGNSGANATPFSTSSVHIKYPKTSISVPLSLRVAPELWLKKLIIGGFDKIYELGPVFRNEGVDSTHNPEFTTCEFYRTFTSLQGLMDLTEQLLLGIVNDLLTDGTPYATACRTHCQDILDACEANGGRFGHIDFVESLEHATGIPLPETLNSETLVQYHKDAGIALPAVTSESQLLDNLGSKLVEPLAAKQSHLPTFIYNTPELLSPLAKSHNGQSRRFELYLGGHELVNAYEEENNPFKQANKFRQQLFEHEEHHDLEAMLPDDAYVRFMEWGMPPTGGWGMGIDRLVMLLTGTKRIDNVLSFGRLPDVLKQ